MAAEFVHLHVHSEYSLLDGYSKTKELAEVRREARHVRRGPDRSRQPVRRDRVLQGLQGRGVKPIVGVETYVAPGKMTAEVRAGPRLLPPDSAGQGRDRLPQPARADHPAWLEGYYYKPRIDRELLAEKNEGLIALSACLGGEVAGPINKGDYDGAPGRTRLVQGGLRRPLLHRDPGARPQGRCRRHAAADPAGARAGHPARRHQRQPLHHQRAGREAGHAALRPDQHHHRRSEADALRDPGVLPQDA